ncbi:PEP-CTERM sorting domain-containing protein [Nitrosomonas sp. Nm166]|uniref:PEP-CTERM sorting domain-containing protein n=1 Tax=Nitrosomonas sp. Nm166 TaxID=1881054 RepID=UPI0008E95D32|nr:PEP-CTERM sorting domain-containing protein [Nitrosomonas sp. Nm166]SFE27316.1 PEP-CTERM protein-sorting domain-containing protein [Nitrosomonas sp. Nm166]
MQIKQILISVVAGLSLLFATQASSSAVIINTTYDLIREGLNATEPFNNGTATIANGDHVELNVSFANNASLTMGDGNEVFRGWLSAGDNDSSFTINNATIEFTGFSGTGGASSLYHLGTQSHGLAHLGPQLIDFLTTDQSVTFTGYKVTYDVQSIAKSPHDYGELWFFASGRNLSISPIPEPSSAILLLVGLMVIIACCYRNNGKS